MLSSKVTEKVQALLSAKS